MTSRFVTRSKIGQQIGWVEEVVILFRVCTLVLSLSTHLLFLTFYSVYTPSLKGNFVFYGKTVAHFSVLQRNKRASKVKQRARRALKQILGDKKESLLRAPFSNFKDNKVYIFFFFLVLFSMKFFFFKHVI